MIGILTVSDRCARGLARDASGPVLEKIAAEQGWSVSAKAIVPDETEKIAAAVLDWVQRKKISLVLTTGGTGVGPRDVTPEAIGPLLDKELAGFGELMRREGLAKTPLAALSRSFAGTRGESLIVSLPGSPKGAEESLRAVLPVIAHALAVLKGADHRGERSR